MWDMFDSYEQMFESIEKKEKNAKEEALKCLNAIGEEESKSIAGQNLNPLNQKSEENKIANVEEIILTDDLRKRIDSTCTQFNGTEQDHKLIIRAATSLIQILQSLENVYLLQVEGSHVALNSLAAMLREDVETLQRKHTERFSVEQLQEHQRALANTTRALQKVELKRQMEYDALVTFSDSASAVTALYCNSNHLISGSTLQLKPLPGFNEESTICVSNLPGDITREKLERYFKNFGTIKSIKMPLKQHSSPEARVQLRCKQLLSALIDSSASDAAKKIDSLQKKLKKDHLELFFLHKYRAKMLRNKTKQHDMSAFEIETKEVNSIEGKGRQIGRRQNDIYYFCCGIRVPLWVKTIQTNIFFVSNTLRFIAPLTGFIYLITIGILETFDVKHFMTISMVNRSIQISEFLFSLTLIMEFSASYTGSVLSIGGSYGGARLFQLTVILSILFNTFAIVASFIFFQQGTLKNHREFIALSNILFAFLAVTGYLDFDRTTWKMYKFRKKQRRIQQAKERGKQKKNDDNKTFLTKDEKQKISRWTYRRPSWLLPSIWSCLSTFECVCSIDLNILDLCRRPSKFCKQLRKPTGAGAGIVCCCNFTEYIYHPGPPGTRQMQLELKAAFERYLGIIKMEDMTTTKDKAKIAVVRRLVLRIQRLKRLIRKRKVKKKKKKRRPTLMRFQDFDQCFRCQVPFSFIITPNHCQHCGYVFCEHCAKNYRDLPELALTQARVCERCTKLIDLGGTL
eukprot:g994.t1